MPTPPPTTKGPKRSFPVFPGNKGAGRPRTTVTPPARPEQAGKGGFLKQIFFFSSGGPPRAGLRGAPNAKRACSGGQAPGGGGGGTPQVRPGGAPIYLDPKRGGVGGAAGMIFPPPFQGTVFCLKAQNSGLCFCPGTPLKTFFRQSCFFFLKTPPFQGFCKRGEVWRDTLFG